MRGTHMKYDISFTLINGFRITQTATETEPTAFVEQFTTKQWIKAADLRGNIAFLKITEVASIEFHPCGQQQ